MQPRLPFEIADAPVVFVRHRRARRYVLRVLADGTVRVTLPSWGAKRDAQAFVKQSETWIARQQARRSLERQQAVPRRDPAADTAWRAQAERELPPLVHRLADAFGLAVTRVTIRNQRARWGSCSRRGAISLNWRLILMPDFVRRYIVIHELMHLREMNHSPRFWRHVADACPDHLEARKWLRTAGRRLLA